MLSDHFRILFDPRRFNRLCSSMASKQSSHMASTLSAPPLKSASRALEPKTGQQGRILRGFDLGTKFYVILVGGPSLILRTWVGRAFTKYFCLRPSLSPPALSCVQSHMSWWVWWDWWACLLHKISVWCRK